MKKIVALFVFILSVVAVNAQVNYLIYRGKEAIFYKVKNSQILWDTEVVHQCDPVLIFKKDKIVFHLNGDEPKELRIIKQGEIYEEDGAKVMPFSCIDPEGDESYVELSVFPKKLQALVTISYNSLGIVFPNLKWD